LTRKFEVVVDIKAIHNAVEKSSEITQKHLKNGKLSLEKLQKKVENTSQSLELFHRSNI
jgi:hypothetical protein